MSDVGGSSGLGGPAGEVFKVTPMDRDSGRGAGQDFAHFKEEDSDAEKKKEPPAGKPSCMMDDVLLSDMARMAIEKAEPPANEIQPEGPAARAVHQSSRRQGSHIDLQA
jgi:hypothetical protein